MARPRKCECGTCKTCVHREYVRAWYWRNRDKACETARATRARHGEKIRATDRARGYRPGAAEKTRARNIVNHEIAQGRLARQPCAVCGAAKTDAHHEDYTKPLQVEWLCKRHHGERHRAPTPGEYPLK